jgi:putative salt-induced outer membrane protein
MRESLLALLTIALGALVLPTAAAAEEPEPPAEADKKPWEFKVAAGISLREGDESKFNGNADTLFKYGWTRDTLTFRALGDYGESDGDRDTENYGANLEWRRDLAGRFFWLSNAGADSDQIQGRNLRVTVNTGPGYRVWQGEENEFFDVATGLGYRHERFRGDDPDNDLLDMIASYDYQQTLGEAVEIIHATDFYAPVNEIENYLVKSEVTLSVPLFSGLHFRNNARYEYVHEPAEDRKSSNFWLTMGLEYRL